QQDAGSLEISEQVTRQLYRDMAERDRVATDRRLAACALAGDQRGPKQRRRYRTSIASTLGDLQRLADLTLNLRLTGDKRIESTGDPKEVLDRLFIDEHITVQIKFVVRHTARLAQYAQKLCAVLVAPFTHGVQLGTITGGEQDAFLHYLSGWGEHLWDLARRAGETFTQRDGCGCVVGADNDDMHVNLINLQNLSDPIEILAFFSF
ncbi:MAG TPA: hypothetical protein VEL31_24510, partial [Ktedonobacteraceae bacterium]|nr:hypothetical protein [Ktedonobacteraceae bacterium]